MAQWDGVGDTQDWGEYYAGRRAAPPASRLDANSERAAWEQAAVTVKVDNDRAARFAAYCAEHGIARVTR